MGCARLNLRGILCISSGEDEDGKVPHFYCDAARLGWEAGLGWERDAPACWERGRASSFCLNLRPDRKPAAQIERTSVGSIFLELRSWVILHQRRLPTRASSPRACAEPLQKSRLPRLRPRVCSKLESRPSCQPIKTETLGS